MARFRFLAVLPFLYLVPFVALERLLAGGPAYDFFLQAEIELVKALGLLGGLMAAWSFGRGEYLRRAWMWTALCSALLILADASMLLGRVEATQALVGPLRGGLVLLANVFQAIGLFLLGYAWSKAGLELTVAPATRVLVAVFTCALALVVAGPAVWLEGARLLGGDWDGAVGVASGLGDIASLTLLAPLFLSYLAYRGGRIGWVWLFLVGSGVAWLLWDAVSVFGGGIGLPEDLVNLVGESCRAIGCLLTLSAGLAQRWAVQG